jgi:hypothetical protein
MELIWAFLSGLIFANGIPHFVHGISGESFHSPALHRLMPQVPSHLFNVLWGLLNFAIALFLFSLVPNIAFGLNGVSVAFGVGFVFASIGLSILFAKRSGR